MKSNHPLNTDKEKYDNELDASFWNLRWQTGRTGWDVGYATPPIIRYFDQLSNKHIAILIPGCGNAYEAEYLIKNGFTNITLVDIAEEAVSRLQKKFTGFEQVKVICEDFFQHQGKYDLIVEQTFFCAQVLERRQQYVQKAASLLSDGGKLVGVLFGIHFEQPGPPFGGDQQEYQSLFSPWFNLKIMAPCYNSIPQRLGAELFICFEKLTTPLK